MEKELTEEQKEKIADDIKNGMTSGRVDLINSDNGKSSYCSWELKTEIWEE